MREHILLKDIYSSDISCPGFVQCDDQNKRMLLLDCKKNMFLMFDLDGYKHLFSVDGEDVNNINVAFETMLLVKIFKATISFEIISLDNASPIASKQCSIQPNRELEFTQHCSTTILLKHTRCDIRIINIFGATEKIIENTAHLLPGSFVFIPTISFVVVSIENTLTLINYNGECVYLMNYHITSDIFFSFSDFLFFASDNTLVIIDINKGKFVKEIIHHSFRHTSAVFFDKSNNKIIIGDDFGCIQICGN